MKTVGSKPLLLLLLCRILSTCTVDHMWYDPDWNPPSPPPSSLPPLFPPSNLSSDLSHSLFHAYTPIEIIVMIE